MGVFARKQKIRIRTRRDRKTLRCRRNTEDVCIAADQVMALPRSPLVPNLAPGESVPHMKTVPFVVTTSRRTESSFVPPTAIAQIGAPVGLSLARKMSRAPAVTS